MTKVFKGPNRFKNEMEWEQKHPEFTVRQIECHNGKVTVFYVPKDDEESKDDA